jgi:predicted PurR-regulated permease PerM
VFKKLLRGVFSVIGIIVGYFISEVLITIPQIASYLSTTIAMVAFYIIISLIFGSALGGFLGMLLAVPVGAYFKLVFVRFINRRLERKEEVKHLEATAGKYKNK